MSTAARKLLVDIHTHLYLPRYAALLRSRTSVPFIRSINPTDERLLILDHEPSGGRPVNSQYWDKERMMRRFYIFSINRHKLIYYQRN
jgi:aminocarboxymuconate-semialdehyde decarboxylase